MSLKGFCAVVALLPAAGAYAQSPFDGKWAVNMACPDSGGAKGYSISYAMDVANGRVLGQRGVKGAPDSLTLTGQIAADGKAQLRVDGLTGGNAAYNVGGGGGGQPVSYAVSAAFQSDRGSGTRTETRPCNLTFIRQLSAAQQAAAQPGAGDWALGRWYGGHHNRGSRTAVKSTGMQMDVEKLADGSYRCTILSEDFPNSPGVTPCFIDATRLKLTTARGNKYDLARSGPNLSGEAEFYSARSNWKVDVSFSRTAP